MVKPSPDIFNPELVARQSERLSVAFPLSQCKRLVALLAGDSGQLEGEFEVIRLGRQITIAGHFATKVTLECQRCLNNLVHPIAAEFKFVLVPDQTAADKLADEQDPLIIGEDGMLNVIDIFEDEIILQLPTVPRHAAVEECIFDVTVEIQDGANFAEAQTAQTAATDMPAVQAGVQRGRDVFAELKNMRFDEKHSDK